MTIDIKVTKDNNILDDPAELKAGDIVELTFPDQEMVPAKVMLVVDSQRATAYGPHRQFGCFLEYNSTAKRWVGTKLFRDAPIPPTLIIHHQQVNIDPAAAYASNSPSA